MLNSYRTINSIINEKLSKSDRNGKEYLLLKLDNSEAIFVFENKELTKDKWLRVNNMNSRLKKVIMAVIS